MGVDKVYPSGGHHQNDPGAICNGKTESKMMSDFRNKVTAKLDKLNHPYGTDKDWETNTQYQNRLKPNTGDVVIDFHMNSFGPTSTGVEVIISDNAGKDSKALAKVLVDGYSKIMGITNRGVKKESETPRKKLGILNKKGTAVLVEFAFISNVSDIKAFENNVEALVDFTVEQIILFDRNHG